MGARVEVGDKAPDFTLPAQGGREVSLSDYRGSQNVVLYFYPKDFTVGCTAEARAFGQNYESLRSHQTEVVGISSDTAESHLAFAEECDVPFPLLSDRGAVVRKAYGVKASLGLIPGRVTFVIDKGGVVRDVFSSQLNPKKHVSEALRAVESLAQDASGSKG